MDLKELRYFRAIAESGTFSKAAAHLRVAQPALSRQMRKLEHDLGVELLRRTSRGVTPTPAGLALLRRTIFLESELEQTRREVTGLSERVTGTLRIAVTWPFSTEMVPRLVLAYHNQHPQVVLHVIEGYSGNITEGLLTEQLDVAIVSAPSHSHIDLACIPLWSDELRLIGPASAEGTNLFRQAQPSLTDLVDVPLILPSQTHAIRRLVDSGFARQQLRHNVAFEADGPALLLSLVREGLGYSIFPPTTSHVMEHRGELISRPLKPAIRRTMAVVTRSVLLKERATASFVHFAKAAAANINAIKQFASSRIYPELRAEFAGS